MREFPFWSTQSGFEKLVCSIMMKSIQTLWYVIPAIASEYPSEYIHHTKEAGSRLEQREEKINLIRVPAGSNRSSAIDIISMSSEKLIGEI